VTSVTALLSVHSRFFRIHFLPALYSNVMFLFVVLAQPELLGDHDGQLLIFLGLDFCMILGVTCYIVANGCTKKKAMIQKNQNERIKRFLEHTRMALDNQSPEDAMIALENLARVGKWLGFLGIDADFVDLELAVLRESSLRAEIDQERLRRRRNSFRIFVLSQATWLVWDVMFTPVFVITVVPKLDNRFCIPAYLLLILGLIIEYSRKKQTEALVESLSTELLELTRAQVPLQQVHSTL